MKQISGIYKIQSICKPDKIYIGSSMNIYKRWIRHKYILHNNKHHSKKLQNHCNKYGLHDLIFSIIITCDVTELLSQEQLYIDIYKPWFNICSETRGSKGRVFSEETLNKFRKPRSKESIEKGRITRLLNPYVHSEETKEKIKLKHLNKIISNTAIDNMRKSSHNLEIVQYDLDNNFIRHWHCSKCASKELNISSASIRSCLKKRRSTAGGYIWKYSQ